MAKKKLPKWLVIMVVMLLLAAGLVVVLLVVGRDIPRPDDQDLQPAPWTAVAANENAFVAVKRAASALTFSDEAREAFEDLQIARDAGDPADPESVELLARFVGENTALIEQVQAALRLPHYRPPRMESFSDPVDALGLRFLGELLDAAALVQMERGEIEGALDVGSSSVRLGERVRRNAQSLIEYLVGNSVRNHGEKLLSQLARDPRASSDLLRVAHLRLTAELARDPRALARALKNEYRVLSSTLDMIASGDDGGVTGNLGVPLSRLTFKPNRTRAVFIEQFRTAVANLGRPYSEQQFQPPPKRSRLQRIKSVLLGNVVGDILQDVSLLVFDDFLAREFEARTHFRATLYLLALRRFHLDRGELPDDLSELVPEYLEALTRDPYDEALPRYSKERRILYFVGEDLLDSGGNTTAGLEDSNEPTLRLDF